MARPRKPVNPEHYVDNKKFYDLLIERKASVKAAIDAGKEPPVISRAIAEKIMKICERLSYSPNFIRYSYRDEMVADAIENCIRYLDKFDPEKSNNPFSYFTQTAWYCLIRRIEREKKEFRKKARYVQCSGQFEHDAFIEGEGPPPEQIELLKKFYELPVDEDMGKRKPKVTKKHEKVNPEQNIVEILNK